MDDAVVCSKPKGNRQIRAFFVGENFATGPVTLGSPFSRIKNRVAKPVNRTTLLNKGKTLS
jgi:hypothetical protein